MTDLSKIGTNRLCSMMWDAMIPAWLGSSAGGILIVMGSLWRWVIFPPRLVIKYSSGSEVWSFQGDLWRDGMPHVPPSANIIYICLIAVGLLCLWYFTHEWRAIRDELQRRRNPTQKEELSDG